MNKTDLKSLEIKKLIETSIVYKDYMTIDLIGIFFHQIMIYATNFYIIKNNKKTYIGKINFPFLNNEYVKEIPTLNFDDSIRRKTSTIHKIIKFIQFFFPFSSSIDIEGEGNAFFEKKIFIVRNFFKYKFNQTLNTKIFIKDKPGQIHNLQILLEKIAIVIDIKEKDDFILNFIKYVNSYISQKPVLSKSDILIVGSNTNLISRINSAIYLSQGKKVICISHGEHSPYVIDEPSTGYGEFSYCRDYINFGRELDYSQLKYAYPIMKLPTVHYRNSKIIKSYYKNHKNIKYINLKNSTKKLYIPTIFSGNARYGPFRDIEDDLYQKWQNSIMSLDYNINYKIHPKNKNEPQSNYQKIVRKNLKDILNKYDFYLLDYISTASALCVATDKPIIYFNIGQRNLLKEAKELLKKRTFWVDIDLNKDLSFQINKAIKDFNEIKKSYVNHYTEKYSLSENNKSAIDILEEILNKT